MYNLFGVNDADLLTVVNLLEGVEPKIYNHELKERIKRVRASLMFALKEKKDYD